MIQTLRSQVIPARKSWLWRGLKSQSRSLCSQIVLWNVGVLVIMLVLIGVLVFELFMQRLLSDIDRHLTLRATELQTTASVWKAAGHPYDTAFYQTLVQYTASDDTTAEPIYVKILDKETAKPLSYSAGLLVDRVHFDTGLFEAAHQNRRVLTTVSDDHSYPVRMFVLPLYDGDSNLIAIAEVMQSLQSVEQVKTTLLIVLVLGGLLAASVAYGMGFWLTNRKLKPLSELATTMHGLSVQDLQTRLPQATGPAEVSLLRDAFNKMAERLEASFALQRSFVADVSHELRTPLTAIRGELDVMLLNPQLEQETRQEIEQLSGELNRLTRMVANLLTNARAETGMLPQVRAHSQPIPLDMLLVETARQGRYINPQSSVEIGRLEQLTVSADRDLLKQLFLNLLDNALTYGGGQVCLALERAIPEGQTEEWAVLSVRDNGPGIAPDDLPHIFERHFRAKPNSVRGKLSAGLGLYIACLIARAHEGHITVESEPGQGTTFSVWLPLVSNGAAIPSLV